MLLEIMFSELRRQPTQMQGHLCLKTQILVIKNVREEKKES